MELWDKQDFSSFSSPLGRTISPKDGQVDIVTANVAIQGGKNEGFNGSVSSGPSLATFTEQKCVFLHPRVTPQNANALCALSSSNMETSVTENLILDCVSQQGDGEDMNFGQCIIASTSFFVEESFQKFTLAPVLVQSSNACEETRVVKSPEPVQYNSPSSTANPGAQSMSLSQASTPTKIHQPRPLYFTSDMFPRTSLLSPFVPPLPLKTKSVDSPSAENPSFISNTDYLPPFRKQRSLPTTITSAMDKAKSSGTKCRPMPRVASFPVCQESVVIGRPRADSIVSDLRYVTPRLVPYIPSMPVHALTIFYQKRVRCYKISSWP
ncbi:hypothetical protein F5051DRAFT_114584 [Lentinula edodes]|nr:hypothetical protein F5051DRAFT_114584 [Lentinula edodes]